LTFLITLADVDRFSKFLTYVRFVRKLAMKEFCKLVYIFRSYDQNASDSVYNIECENTFLKQYLCFWKVSK